MIQNHLLRTKCFVCYPKTVQHRIIVKSLLKKLIYQKSMADLEDQQATKNLNNEGFHDLVKSIMMYDMKKMANISNTMICKHLSLQNAFKKKLKCDGNFLNKICNELVMNNSQIQYHLWLLISSIKNVASKVQRQSSKLYKNLKRVQVQGMLSKKYIQNQEKRENQLKNECFSAENLVIQGFMPKQHISFNQGIHQQKLLTSGFICDQKANNNP